ncbi:MAG TPA: hypothetical protein VHN99_03545 [Deinococcales bacterium]|nr:hypothetical protein [Deinococcales bacterium]
MPKASVPEALFGLVYERTPGWELGWVCVSLVPARRGFKVLVDSLHLTVELDPSEFVLVGLARAVEAIRPDELARGTASVGPAGLAIAALFGSGRLEGLPA